MTWHPRPDPHAPGPRPPAWALALAAFYGLASLLHLVR